MPLAILPRKERPQSLKWLIPQLSSAELIHDIVVRQVGYDFRLKSNERKFVQPRQMAIWLMREVAHLSYPQIGRFYSLHHTTVLYSEQIINRACRTNPACSHDAQLLLSLVEESIRRENTQVSKSGA